MADGGVATALTAEQHAWEAFRDLSCAFKLDEGFGGAGGPTGYHACRAEVIASRTAALQGYIKYIRQLSRSATAQSQRIDQNSLPPSGTLRSIAPSTTAPSSSGKPSVSTSDMNLPIWRGGKLTTAKTCRPTSVSGE